MRRRGLIRRLERSAKKRPDRRRTHYIFLNWNETDSKAQKSDMIARGVARATDRFIVFSWKPPADDTPQPETPAP